MPKKGPELKDVDIDATRFVTSMTLRPSERLFLASVSRENGVSEAEVLKQGLLLLKTLGKLGFTDEVVISPSATDDVRTRLMLEIDPTQGMFSVEEFRELQARQ